MGELRADPIAAQTIVDLAQVISDLQEIVYEKAAYVGQLENGVIQLKALIEEKDMQLEQKSTEVAGLRAELERVGDLAGTRRDTGADSDASTNGDSNTVLAGGAGERQENGRQGEPTKAPIGHSRQLQRQDHSGIG